MQKLRVGFLNSAAGGAAGRRRAHSGEYRRRRRLSLALTGGRSIAASRCIKLGRFRTRCRPNVLLNLEATKKIKITS